MITLHQYPPSFGLSSLSPFCIKVEFFLKAAQLPYTVKTEFNPKVGPKGKMPFIQHEQATIADSSLIIEHLLNSHSLNHLNIINPEKRAIAQAFKSMIEEHLYFILLYSRWIDPAGFKVIKGHFKTLFPPIVGNVFMEILRRSLTKQGMAQGIARHNVDEVYAMGINQLDALSKLLGKNEYFFEDKITYFDATAYSFLVTIVKQPIETPLKDFLNSCENLLNYIQRMDHYFNN